MFTRPSQFSQVLGMTDCLDFYCCVRHGYPKFSLTVIACPYPKPISAYHHFGTSACLSVEYIRLHAYMIRLIFFIMHFRSWIDSAFQDGPNFLKLYHQAYMSTKVTVSFSIVVQNLVLVSMILSIKFIRFAGNAQKHSIARANVHYILSMSVIQWFYSIKTTWVCYMNVMASQLDGLLKSLFRLTADTIKAPRKCCHAATSSHRWFYRNKRTPAARQVCFC